MPVDVLVGTAHFEDSECWAMVKQGLTELADLYELDEEVLITAVTETVDSIINE